MIFTGWWFNETDELFVLAGWVAATACNDGFVEEDVLVDGLLLLIVWLLLTDGTVVVIIPLPVVAAWWWWLTLLWIVVLINGDVVGDVVDDIALIDEADGDDWTVVLITGQIVAGKLPGTVQSISVGNVYTLHSMKNWFLIGEY